MIQLEQLYQYYLQHPKVITDSRKIEQGCLFFALKGPNFDGNKYATDALKNGAAYAIVDDPQYQKGKTYLLVEDVLETLQALARHHRQQLEIPVIAITGSNGKTTTKELLSLVMSSHYRTHFTKGNFNNHIGVPLTLLAMPLDTEVAIIEMGANHLEEIALLCSIALPSHGLITNIGKAHLEGFCGVEGVKKGKGELFDFLAEHNGLAFVNRDELYLTDLAKAVRHQLFYVQSEKLDPDEDDYQTELVGVTPFVRVAFLNEVGGRTEVASQLVGVYNFQNIQTAVVLGRYFKVPSVKIKAAIEGYLPQNNRSQLIEKSTNTYLLDAYNANPTSMENALAYFAKVKAENKVAVLGDMLELGEYSETEHQKVLESAVANSFSAILLVGKAFGALMLNDKLTNVYQFENVAKLKEWLDQRVFENTHFLIKGSRGIRLEEILK